MKKGKFGLGIKLYAPKRERPIIETTKATSDFLAIIHEQYPTYSISQLKEVLTNKTKFIPNYEAIKVIDAYINLGYGDIVPEWRFF